jgi:hypothetical protein
MHSKRKTQPLVLGLFVIFLTTSCASCNQSFDWDPRPSVGDSLGEQIVDDEGNTVKCSEPRFDTYTCFDSENIAELRTAIDQVEDKRVKKKLQKALKDADSKVWRAKQNK